MPEPNKIDPTLPEIVQKFLRSGARLEEIRLDSRGRWTHEGLAFQNERLIRLFSRSIDRTEGGTWVLRIGSFTYPIVVEDTGFFVEHVDWSTVPARISLSDESVEELDLQSLSYLPEGRLYCLVKDRQFKSRFLRDAYHSVMEFLYEADGQIWLRHGDDSISLGTME